MQSSETANGPGADPILRPFAEFWSEYMDQADKTARQLQKNFEEYGNARGWQQRWLEAVGRSMDAYMRSPVFLRAMKQNTDRAIKVKMQADDLATEFARNMNLPMASDISGLFERLHSVEETILSRLTRIEERLDSIEAQGQRLETRV